MSNSIDGGGSAALVSTPLLQPIPFAHCPIAHCTIFSCDYRYDVCPAEIAGLPVIPRQPSSIVGLEGCFNGTCSGLTQSR